MAPKRKQPARESGAEAKKAKMEKELGGDLNKFGLGWSSVGKTGVKEIPPLVCLTSEELEGKSKIAGFDIDWTVIKTKSGKKFPTGVSDWTWWDAKVPGKLRDLHKDGYRLIFFSNQSGVEKGKAKIEDIQKKCVAIIQELGVPIFIFFSTGESHYRKPSTEVWKYFSQKCNKGVKVNLSSSYYVGDAAGRAKDWAPGKPKDFSCSDRMFAANAGLKFETPEEFFLGEKPAKFSWGSWDPKTAGSGGGSGSKAYHSSAQELALMVGMPASGKSSFVKKHLLPHGYVHVNRDTLGTLPKCLKVAADSLKSGKSVVIDNTNPTKAGRAEFVSLAAKQKVPCRCFYLDMPKELAHHLNYVRQNMTEGKVRRIPDVGYNVFFKGFEAPEKSEGFADVLKVSFAPDFENEKHKELFMQWTA